MRDRAKKWTHRKAIRFTTSVSRLPFHGFVSRKKRSNREDDVRLVPILPRVEAAARAGQSCRERPRVAPRDAICSDAEDPRRTCLPSLPTSLLDCVLAIVLLAAMLDCQGTVQYRYCTGACVPAPAVCLFTAGTVPVRPPTADTRKTQGNPRGGCRGVHRGARRAEIAPPSLIEARN